MTAILSLNHVSHTYHTLRGETKALDNISFSVEEGERIAIVGPSGCGKSTILSLVSGLLPCTEGTILIHDKPASHAASRIGYMLQHDHLLDWRSVYRNVTLGLDINHQNTPENRIFIDHLLKEYGLWEFRTKPPRELSGGMKQRAALIRTLALKPDLLLLDEPFSALDYQTRLSVSADICQLIRKQNKTMLLVTHDLSEAISIADRIIVLSNKPARVKAVIPIQLTKSDDSMLAARNAPEFQHYFNYLWEEIK